MTTRQDPVKLQVMEHIAVGGGPQTQFMCYDRAETQDPLEYVANSCLPGISSNPYVDIGAMKY